MRLDHLLSKGPLVTVIFSAHFGWGWWCGGVDRQLNTVVIGHLPDYVLPSFVGVGCWVVGGWLWGGHTVGFSDHGRLLRADCFPVGGGGGWCVVGVWFGWLATWWAHVVWVWLCGVAGWLRTAQWTRASFVAKL